MTEIGRRHVIDVLEGSGEVGGAVEAALFGDDLDRVRCGLQQMLGLEQAVLQEVFVGRTAKVFLEGPDEVG